MAEDWSFLDELNLSELVQMAWLVNPGAHRSLPRDTLYAIIQGEEVWLPERHVDIWRHTIFKFCDMHWQQVNPLLSCPMKSRKPHACFNCPDIQVAECTLVNHETLLQERNKKRGSKT